MEDCQELKTLTVLNNDFGSCILLADSGDERGDSGDSLYTEKLLASCFNSIVLPGEPELEEEDDDKSSEIMLLPMDGSEQEGSRWCHDGQKRKARWDGLLSAEPEV